MLTAPVLHRAMMIPDFLAVGFMATQACGAAPGAARLNCNVSRCREQRPFGAVFCFARSPPSEVNFPAPSTHVAQALFDLVPPVFKRFCRHSLFRCQAASANRDKKDQAAEKNGHPADDQRYAQSIHNKNRKR